MLSQIVNLKEKPHSVIFIETKFCDVKKTINCYLKSLVCTKIPFCDKCKECLKIENNSYFDLVYLDGYDHSIKKDEILEIQNKFSQSSFEAANKKIYVIYGVENTTKEGLNSLLKFLEEPPTTNNIYAIFTTKNYNKILPTIKSRCIAFFLDSNKQDFVNKLNKTKFSNENIQIILSLFNNYEEFKKEYDSGEYSQIMNFIKKLDKFYDDPTYLLDLLNEFKKYDYSFIKKILQYLKILRKDNNALQLSKLSQVINLSPNKTLIFNELINIVKEKQNNE